MDLARELPYSNDAEQAVIGSIIIEPDLIVDALDILKVDYFYAERNKYIFSAMVELFNTGVPIDAVTLGNLLEKEGVFDALGGHNYLKDIVTNVPASINISSYCKIIKEKYLARCLIKASEDINRLCYGEDDISSVMDMSVAKIFDVAQQRDNQSVTQIRSIIYDNYNKLNELMQSGVKFNGIPTGYTGLDMKIQGLQPGQLVLVAARPAMGKSSFAVNIAQYVAIKKNITTAIFTLEMTKEEVTSRIVSSEAKIDNKKMKTGDLSPQEVERYCEVLEPVASAPIYIDDTASISSTEMRAKCKRLKLEKNLGLVVVDYLQLMTGSGRESRQQEISEISRSLKLLAKELEIPVIALSQLSRAPEQRTDHRPMLSDLRESGSIEQDADIVLFLYRDDMYNQDSEEKNIAECIVAKNRSGETGTTKLTWIGELTTFCNMENVYGS